MNSWGSCYGAGGGKRLQRTQPCAGSMSFREESHGRITARSRRCFSASSQVHGSQLWKKLTLRYHSWPSPDPRSPTWQHFFPSLLAQESPTGFFCPYNIHSLFQWLLLILGWGKGVVWCGFFFISSTISVSEAKFLKHWWLFQLGLVCIRITKNISCIQSLLSFQLHFIQLCSKKSIISQCFIFSSWHNCHIPSCTH